MNISFMKRSHAQNVGIPISMGTAYGVGNSEGCAALGYAATCSEVSETNPSSVRESNSFAHSLKGFFSGISYRTIVLLFCFLMIGEMILASSPLIYMGSIPENNSDVKSLETIGLKFDLSALDDEVDYTSASDGAWGVCAYGYKSSRASARYAKIYKGDLNSGEVVGENYSSYNPSMDTWVASDILEINFEGIAVDPGQLYTVVINYDIFASKAGTTYKEATLTLNNDPIILTFYGANETDKVLAVESTTFTSNKLESISNFNIYFNYEVNIDSEVNFKLFENENLIAISESVSIDQNDSKCVNVGFIETPLYKGHNYQLVLESGVFFVKDDVAVKNSNISIPIEGTSFHMFGKKTVLPREGQQSLLEEIQMSFDFPEGYGFVYVSDDTKYPMQVYKVKSDGEELVEEVNGEYFNDVTLKFTPKNVLDASTKYKFVLEEDVVKPYQLGLSYPKRLQDYKCERIEVEYRTPDEGDIPKVSFKEMSEDELTIAYLDSFIRLPINEYEVMEESYVVQNTGYGYFPLIVSDGVSTSEIGEIFIQTTTDENGVYLWPRFFRAPNANNSIDLNLELEAGKTYTLTIPEGRFAASQPLLKKYSGNEEFSYVFHGTTPISHTVIIYGSEGHATKLKAKRHQDMEVEFSAPENRNIEKVTYQEADSDTIDITEEAKTGSYLLTDICNDAQFFVTLDAATPVAPEYVNVSLTVGHKDNHSVVYSHPTVKSQAAAVNVSGANGWSLESLSLNDEDVDIENVKDGVYTIPAESLNKDAALNAVFAYSDKPIFDFTTGVDTVEGCDYRVYSEDSGTLVIENIPANTMVSVYSTAGLHIVSENSGNSDVARIPLAPGIYVVVIGQDALKIKH